MKLTTLLPITVLALAGFALAQEDSLVIPTNSAAAADGGLVAPTKSPEASKPVEPKRTMLAEQPAPSLGKEVMAPSMPSLGKQVIDHIEEQVMNKENFVEIGGGLIWGIDGDFTNGFDTSLDKNAFGSSEHKTESSFNGLSFDDIYGEAHSFHARLGRALGRNNVYVRVAYTEASGGTSHLGTIGDCDLFGNFGDYQDWGLLVGFERQLNEAGKISPYFGFEAGVRFVNNVDVDLVATNDHHGHSFYGVPFYDDTAVFTAEFVVGVDFDVTNNFALGVETGLRYQTGLDQEDAALAWFGIEELNDADGNFLAIPVMVTGTINF